MNDNTPKEIVVYKKQFLRNLLRKIFNKRVGIIAVVLAIVIGIGAFIYSKDIVTVQLNLSKDEEIGSDILGTMDKPSAEQEIIARVAKLTDIPDETPKIGRVDDAEKAKQNPFFAKSENGDFLLVFEKAKYAILYRPSTDKIITAGPVTVAEPPVATPSGTLISPTFIPNNLLIEETQAPSPAYEITPAP